MVDPKANSQFKKFSKRGSGSNILKKNGKRTYLKQKDIVLTNLINTNDNIKHILDDRFNEMFKQTPIKSKSYRKFFRHSNRVCKNWDKSSLYCSKYVSEFSHECIDLLDKSEFYISGLAPSIIPSNVKIGDKIFRMSLIPGREKSMIWNDVPKENINTSADNPDEIGIDISIRENNTDPNYCDSVVELIPVVNNCVFISMFNNHRYSDLFILLKSGEILYLHKFVLAAWKCDDAFIKESQYFVTMDDDIVIRTFKYLYSDGKIPIDDIVDTDGCIALCSKFGIDRRLLKKSQLLSPIKNYFPLHSPATNSVETIKEMSPFMKSPLEPQFDNGIMKNREIFHSTPNCQLFQKNLLSQTHKTAARLDSSEVDLFDSFSLDMSMDCTKNSLYHCSQGNPVPLNSETKPDNIPDFYLPETACDVIKSSYAPTAPVEEVLTDTEKIENSLTYNGLVTPLPLCQRINIITANARQDESVIDLDTSNNNDTDTNLQVPSSCGHSGSSPSSDRRENSHLSLYNIPVSPKRNSDLNLHSSQFSNNDTDINLQVQSFCGDSGSSPSQFINNYTDTNFQISMSCRAGSSSPTVDGHDNSNFPIYNIPVSPKRSSEPRQDSSQFIASPYSLPLSERMKLNTQILPANENYFMRDIEKKESGDTMTDKKKKVSLRKSLSYDNVKKKPLKRQSSEKMDKLIAESPNKKSDVTESKKKRTKINKTKLKFETPPKRVYEFNPFTPMPDYANMPSPELQRHRIKYGLKKELPKKKSIIYLQECHRRTHRIDDGTETESSTASGDSDIPLTQDVPLDDGDRSSDVTDAKKNEYLYNFLRANYLYDILTFKALNVVEIVAELKLANIKQDMKHLYDYLDSQCISYKKVETNQKWLSRPKTTKHFVR